MRKREDQSRAMDATVPYQCLLGVGMEEVRINWVFLRITVTAVYFVCLISIILGSFHQMSLTSNLTLDALNVLSKIVSI